MDTAQSCYITAEAGINHNGDLELAREMIQEAKAAGVDCVKFQYLIADEIAEPGSKYYEVFQQAELEHQELKELKQYTEEEVHLDFKITATSPRTARRVMDLNPDRVKIGSANITNTPMLQIIGEHKDDVEIYLSSGMATIGEIEKALRDLGYTEDDENFYLYHCVSNYPADHENLNLLSIRTLRKQFPELPIGFSDHTTDSIAAVASVALGARLFEKHFTLDHDLEGPDHGFSANPQELRNYVDAIRKASESLGSSKKQPAQSEVDQIDQVRRFLVASEEIEEGDPFNLNNITTKRVDDPSDAVEASSFDRLRSLTAPRSYQPGDVLNWNDFS